jgi:predicted DCC family thiol-disulfide oxidoreductase YuxK
VERKIVFYDGDCGLCNRSVQWILKYDKKEQFFFSALQSDFAKQFFKAHHQPEPDLSTIVFFNGKDFYRKSSAILRISHYLKFPHFLLKAGWILPVFLRDGMYNFIAKRRQKFGNSNCFVPSLNEQQRFLTEALQNA